MSRRRSDATGWVRRSRGDSAGGGDRARSGTGSGLGLAIVQELALAHGGAVYAENVAPHGARVGVILPRLPRLREAAAADAAASG